MLRPIGVEQPQLFDADNVTQSVGAYYVGLIKILDRQGLCAYYDGEELGVTDSEIRIAFGDVMNRRGS